MATKTDVLAVMPKPAAAAPKAKDAPKAKPAAAPKAKDAKPAAKAKDAPKAKPAAKDAKPAKPAAAPKAKDAPKPAAAPSAFALHLNKTGRLCIGSAAAARLGNAPFATIAIEGKLIRLVPQTKEVEGAMKVQSASGRPYVSATKPFKSLGFDGSEPRDFEAKPYGTAGFEFRY